MLQSDMKLLTMNVMKETKEELVNFTFSFRVYLAVLLVSESVESQRNHVVRTLRAISNKDVSKCKLVLLCYKGNWFMVLTVCHSIQEHCSSNGIIATLSLIPFYYYYWYYHYQHQHHHHCHHYLQVLPEEDNI